MMRWRASLISRLGNFRGSRVERSANRNTMLALTIC